MARGAFGPALTEKFIIDALDVNIPFVDSIDASTLIIVS